jgi:DNA-directed RNA polymerase beta' subunit
MNILNNPELINSNTINNNKGNNNKGLNLIRKLVLSKNTSKFVANLNFASNLNTYLNVGILEKKRDNKLSNSNTISQLPINHIQPSVVPQVKSVMEGPGLIWASLNKSKNQKKVFSTYLNLESPNKLTTFYLNKSYKNLNFKQQNLNKNIKLVIKNVISKNKVNFSTFAFGQKNFNNKNNKKQELTLAQSFPYNPSPLVTVPLVNKTWQLNNRSMSLRTPDERGAKLPSYFGLQGSGSFLNFSACATNMGSSTGTDTSFAGVGSYSKMTEINLITISLASANRIRQWAEKTLPNGKVVGEVINPETVHYKTLKPIKGGLFCERIFGPLKDHECACGKKFNIKNYLLLISNNKLSENNLPMLKRQMLKTNTLNSNFLNTNLLSLDKNQQVALQKRYFCRICDVEYTYSIIRRTQLGYIQLASPTTHVWFVKGTPSYISILLDMKKKHLQNVTYNAETLTLEHAFRGRQYLPSSPSSIFESWQKIMKKQYVAKAKPVLHITDKKGPKIGIQLPKGIKGNKNTNKKEYSTSKKTTKKLNKNYLYKENKKRYYCSKLNFADATGALKNLKLNFSPNKLNRDKHLKPTPNKFINQEGVSVAFNKSKTDLFKKGSPKSLLCCADTVPPIAPLTQSQHLNTKRVRTSYKNPPTSTLKVAPEGVITKRVQLLITPTLIPRTHSNSLKPKTFKSVLFKSKQDKTVSAKADPNGVSLITPLIPRVKRSKGVLKAPKYQGGAVPIAPLACNPPRSYTPKKEGAGKKKYEGRSMWGRMRVQVIQTRAQYQHRQEQKNVMKQLNFASKGAYVGKPVFHLGLPLELLKVLVSPQKPSQQSTYRLIPNKKGWFKFINRTSIAALYKTWAVSQGGTYLKHAKSKKIFDINKIKQNKKLKPLSFLKLAYKLDRPALIIKKNYKKEEADFKLAKSRLKNLFISTNLNRLQFLLKLFENINKSKIINPAINIKKNCFSNFKIGKTLGEANIKKSFWFNNIRRGGITGTQSNKFVNRFKFAYITSCMREAGAGKIKRLLLLKEVFKLLKNKNKKLAIPLYLLFFNKAVEKTNKTSITNIKFLEPVVIRAECPQKIGEFKHDKLKFEAARFAILRKKQNIIKSKSLKINQLNKYLLNYGDIKLCSFFIKINQKTNSFLSQVFFKGFKSSPSGNCPGFIQGGLFKKHSPSGNCIEVLNFLFKKGSYNLNFDIDFRKEKLNNFKLNLKLLLTQNTKGLVQHVITYNPNLIYMQDMNWYKALSVLNESKPTPNTNQEGVVSLQDYLTFFAHLKFPEGEKHITKLALMLVLNLKKAYITEKFKKEQKQINANHPALFNKTWCVTLGTKGEERGESKQIPKTTSTKKGETKTIYMFLELFNNCKKQVKTKIVKRLYACYLFNQSLLPFKQLKFLSKNIPYQLSNLLIIKKDKFKPFLNRPSKLNSEIGAEPPYKLKGKLNRSLINTASSAIKFFFCLKISKNLTQYCFFLKQNKKKIAYKLYNSLVADLKKMKNKYLKYLFLSFTFFSYKKQTNLKSHLLNFKNVGLLFLVYRSKYCTPKQLNSGYTYEGPFCEDTYASEANNKYKTPLKFEPIFNLIHKFKGVGTYKSAQNSVPINRNFLNCTQTKNLIINNIYCLSHRELWEQEKDWQDFAYYYYSPTNITDRAIPLYKHRNYDLLFNIDNLIQENHNNFNNIELYSLGMNINTAFSGAGLIQKLLNEFNYSELKKMDKQNRILLFEYNKYIKKLKKMMNSRWTPPIGGPNTNSRSPAGNYIGSVINKKTNLNKFKQGNKSTTSGNRYEGRGTKAKVGLMKSRLEYYKACHIRDLLIRRTKLTRKIFNKIINIIPNLKNPPDPLHSGQRNTQHQPRQQNSSGLSVPIKLNLGDNNGNEFNFKFTKEQSSYGVFPVGETNGLNMILTLLPVLPPVLRPVLKMSGQFTISDLNRLYQRIIYRNERLKKFLKDPALSGSFEMKYAQRLLQEAVDNLIQNGKSGVVPEKDARGRLLKSLSDILKGKQGRFRQYLLGKRVDYSGRSVIVVGPSLKLHECGIPKEMALVLYSPFLIKRILNEKLAETYLSAKKLIQTNPLLVSQLLREIMKTCPVLLNRAPTLHRLGFQAFQPKLVDGKAILLHPLVCPAFNADFDGDQMAVHVPITFEARAEAWKLMLARNNLLSSSTGDPIILPSQDMVLGCYYLTTNCKSSNILNNKKKLSYKSLNVFKMDNYKEKVLNYKEKLTDLKFKNNNLKMTPPKQLNNLKFHTNSFLGGNEVSKNQLLKTNKLNGRAEKWNKFKKGSGMYFHSINDVLKAYNQQLIHMHAIIWVNIKGQVETENNLEQPLEIRIPLTCKQDMNWYEGQKYVIKNQHWPSYFGLIQKSALDSPHTNSLKNAPYKLNSESVLEPFYQEGNKNTNKFAIYPERIDDKFKFEINSNLNYIEIYSKAHYKLNSKKTNKLEDTRMLSSLQPAPGPPGFLGAHVPLQETTPAKLVLVRTPRSMKARVGNLAQLPKLTNQIIRTTPGKILFNMIIKNAIEKRPALLSKYSYGAGLVKNKLINSFDLQIDNFFNRKNLIKNTSLNSLNL